MPLVGLQLINDTYSMEKSLSWEATSCLVKKFPAFHGTRNFITVFTRLRCSSLYCARWIHSMPSKPTSFNVHLNIIMFASHFLTYIYVVLDSATILRIVQDIKFLITQSSLPAPCCFVFLRSKYSSQNFVLEDLPSDLCYPVSVTDLSFSMVENALN